MSDEDAYARALGRIACAQIVYATSERLYERNAHQASAAASTSTTAKGKPKKPLTASTVSATTAVADAFSELLGSFVANLGVRAHTRAELAGRTRGTLPDVLAAINEAARTTRTNTRDLAQYAQYEAVSFPRNVPAFPALPRAPGTGRKRPRNEGDKPLSGGESWMPLLPPAHTYVSTKVPAKDAAKRPKRADVCEQRRQVEKSLARLKDARAQPPKEVAHNPFLKPPKIGKGVSAVDEGRNSEPRPPPEPVAEDQRDMRDSNFGGRSGSGESEAKKARVERILADSGGYSGADNAGLVGTDKGKAGTKGAGNGKNGNGKNGSGKNAAKSSGGNGKSNVKSNGKGGSKGGAPKIPEMLVPLSAPKK